MAYLAGILIFTTVFSLVWFSSLGTEIAIWVYAKGNDELSKSFRKWETRGMYLCMGITGVGVLYFLGKFYDHIMHVLVRGI